MNNNKWFGNPDPYEELMDAIRRDNENEFNTLMNGTPDAGLKEQFAKSTKVYDIADAMARFTNANFVTNETISGTDKNGVAKQQITHPESPYPSPLLNQMTYDENDNSYKTSAGIRQCTDRSYFMKYLPMVTEPYVDIKTVRAQASVLVPNLLEAGIQVIRLFIPKITIQITSLDDAGIKGEIRHQTDDEYTKEIRYNGPVKITIRDEKFKKISEQEIETVNGKFESEKIHAGKNQRVVASIMFGGIDIESNEFKSWWERRYHRFV
ncbi:MAG: hypothetical protein IPP73_01035 [Chitinophagaceae bacterium]|nr:hypothetical protein [Chitinophagaceae bacterium]